MLSLCDLSPLYNVRTELGFRGHFWRDEEAGVPSSFKEQLGGASSVEWMAQTADVALSFPLLGEGQ